MGKLLYLYYQPPETFNGVHPTAVVDETAILGKNISIGANSVIGRNTVIGDNTQILPNVTIGASVKMGNECLIYPNVYIGDRVFIGNKVIIHAGTTVGSDGFSFVTEKPSNVETARASGELGVTRNQVNVKVPSIGTIEIHDDVEIGANSTIDRGTIQNTIIGKNTKLDNQIQIAHNVQMGESCLMAGQSGVSGSTKVGNRCIIGGQVGLSDHIEIGDDIIVMGKSGVSKNLPARGIYIGNPATTRKEFAKQMQHIKSIADIKEKIKVLFEREKV
jgi:UDP-3-O-[3-hydroxymyristoyl] glucosamine N-acyltransferase